MRKQKKILLTLIASATLIIGCRNTPKENEKTEAVAEIEQASEPEWKMLFNGTDFDGWRSITSDGPPEYGWKIADNELITEESGGAESENGGDIVTLKKYSDFEFEWEWKMLTKGGNSGVKYFVNNASDDNVKYGLGIEYQILDDENHIWMLEGKMKPGDFHTVGAAYELYAPSKERKVAPLGEWNTSKIVSKDGKTEHWLNGIKVVEFDRFSEDFKKRVAASKFKDNESFGRQESGFLLLQDHGGNVHFRNIKIREL